MPTYNDHGIVLNSYNLGEADKILNIYTKENGLVRAVGKGLRKVNSKISSKVDQLSCCYFQFAKGKNLDIISECEQVNSFSLLRSDLTRLTYGILFLEIVSNFAHEQESESNLTYDLLYSSLDNLQTTSTPDLLSVNFITRFLLIHGYTPQIESCVSCNNKIPASEALTKYPYSSALGGLLCRDCSGLVDHKLIDKSVIGIITAQNSFPSKEDTKLALELLREHIDGRAKSKIKTFDLLFSL